MRSASRSLMDVSRYSHALTVLPNVMVQWLTLLRIREVPGIKIGPGYPD
jgi:hypothetical protein